VPRRNNRPRSPTELREHILNSAAAAFCHICWESIYPWQPLNWDHVVPMAKGGARGVKNKRLTHEICNTVKGDQIDFYLRTEAEREAIRLLVKPATYARLVRAWNGYAEELV